jgi:hypothetical protein
MAHVRKLLRVVWVECGTQKAAAEKLGVDHRTVQDIFAGGNVPRRFVVALAEHHGMTVEDLLAGAT